MKSDDQKKLPTEKTLSDQNLCTEPVGVSIRLSRPWQIVILGAVCFHLIAVFSEPFHFFSRSRVQSGADADILRRVFRPYAQFLFLDHGYFFFAPNPGPGHLLRVAADSDPLPPPANLFQVNPHEGVLIPDRNRHRPRLLYHRYLMFAEFVNSRFAPPELDPELARDPLIQKSWENDSAIYRNLIGAISENVKRETGKPFVRVDRLEREIPDRISTLQRNVRISDPRWVRILPESLSDFPPPPPPASIAPSSPSNGAYPSSEANVQVEELLIPK
jgi:hypothetical protein